MTAETSTTELSILMPVFNEEATLERAIQRVTEADVGTASWELVIVDDGSADRSREILAGLDDARIRVDLRESNAGKGAAIRRGLELAEGTYVVILDADLEYDPGDLANLLAPVRAGLADAAYGSRSFQAHASYSFWYVMGNRFLNFATSFIFNSWVTDVYTCLKLMPTELMRSLDLKANGFTLEAEITGRLLRRKARIFEVPITYIARRREEGKKIKPSDGIRGLLTLLRVRFS
jgi:glycosyltransferase involved in cell wall biosynthesis